MIPRTQKEIFEILDQVRSYLVVPDRNETWNDSAVVQVEFIFTVRLQCGHSKIKFVFIQSCPVTLEFGHVTIK